MNKFMAFSITCLFLAMPALADTTFWTPDPADVQKADAEIGKVVNFTGFTCPARSITDFARYYTGFTDRNGRRLIVGQFLLAENDHRQAAGIHIQSLPGITDGGCSIANVRFEAETLKLIQASWGGR